MSDETPPAPRRPWWRPNARDVVVVLLLAVIVGWMSWPRQPPGPVQLLQRGSVGGLAWSVLAQRAGSSHACLQVRAGGARRALMCDQHWDRDVHRLWHGPLPSSAGSDIGPPSLLRVRFPGSDQVLVVSVLYREIDTLTTPSTGARDPVVLHTTRLFDTKLNYIIAVLAAADAAELQAFAADGEPLFYYYADVRFGPHSPGMSAETLAEPLETSISVLAAVVDVTARLR